MVRFVSAQLRARSLRFAHSSQLCEQRESVAHLATVRGVDERERLDVAELHRGHRQDDRGQARALDLGLRECRPREEVVLGVQPDADPRTEAPTPARALVGRGARDGLDRQPLHLRAVAVARDPRGAGVDDVPDAGHR